MAEEQPKKRPATAEDGETFELVVAGAHMSGLFLNHQLTGLDATLVKACKTAPVYKMYSLGPKPALIRQPKESKDGAAFNVEVWAVPIEKVGSFLRDGVKPPLCIGDVLLEGGAEVKGFLGESYAVADAPDVSEHGGWREYLAAQEKEKAAADGKAAEAAEAADTKEAEAAEAADSKEAEAAEAADSKEAKAAEQK